MKIGRLITVGIVLLVTGILFVARANMETQRQEFKLVSKNDISVTLIAPDLKLEVKNKKTGQSIILDGISAQVLSNGDILYNANDYSLRKVSWDGKEEVLIPFWEVNAPIYLNEDETLVAFTKAEDFRGGEFPFTNGVAVYNLKTGEVRVLLTKKGETIGNYGWIGDQLLIDLPGDDGFEPLLLDLDGNLTPFYNGPLLPLVRKWPKRSFDGRFRS